MEEQKTYETADFYKVVSTGTTAHSTELEAVREWGKGNQVDAAEAPTQTLKIVAYKLVAIEEREYTGKDLAEKLLASGAIKREPEPFFDKVTDLIAFDTETTGVDEENDIIITASLVRVGTDGVRGTQDFLINPGLKEIPIEATAIHGITTERARKEGVDVREALTAIRNSLEAGWKSGAVVVAMNASFDFTILLNELKRYGLPELEIGPIFDPIVIDRHYDKYRKGKRTLASLAQHYGVSLENAHSSFGDAVAAARIAYVLIKKHRTVFDRIGASGLRQLQQKAHMDWATNYQHYLRTVKGETTAVIDGSWPIRRTKEKT